MLELRGVVTRLLKVTIVIYGGEKELILDRGNPVWRSPCDHHRLFYILIKEFFAFVPYLASL